MNYQECFADWKTRNESLLSRMKSATASLDTNSLNQNPQPGIWSPAQVVEHLVLSNAPYLKTMSSALERAERSPSVPSIHFSFFGKMIAQTAGPKGNAPAPRRLHPRQTPLSRDILEEWQQQQQQLLSLIDQAVGVDISRTPVRNPLVPVIRMNVADCFEILTGHTERHVGQIEERVLQNCKQTTSV